MRWKIDNDYTIERADHAFMLRKYQIGEINPKTEKPIVRTGEWYFPTINMCLKKYIQEFILPDTGISDNIETSIGILARIEQLEATIDNLELPTFAQMKSKDISEEK